MRSNVNAHDCKTIGLKHYAHRILLFSLLVIIVSKRNSVKLGVSFKKGEKSYLID